MDDNNKSNEILTNYIYLLKSHCLKYNVLSGFNSFQLEKLFVEIDKINQNYINLRNQCFGIITFDTFISENYRSDFYELIHPSKRLLILDNLDKMLSLLNDLMAKSFNSLDLLLKFNLNKNNLNGKLNDNSKSINPYSNSLLNSELINIYSIIILINNYISKAQIEFSSFSTNLKDRDKLIKRANGKNNINENLQDDKLQDQSLDLSQCINNSNI